MRKLIVAANWKMNKTPDEAKVFVEEIKAGINNAEADVFVFPPFLALQTVSEILKDADVNVGAQNMYIEDKGAYTGEISADMLQSIGINSIIIGHSERRQIFKEDDELISLRKWASDASVLDYDKFGVKGIGFTTYQYIRMLLGANTVKPDVHIKNKISEIVGRKVNDKYAVQLFESACRNLKLNIVDVEHYIWKKNANNSEEFNMVWEDNKWVELDLK